MWRVRHPDGRLSDMANLTWAKEGAISLALGHLNKQRCRETAPGASPIRFPGVPGISPHAIVVATSEAPLRRALTEPGLLCSVLGGETWRAWLEILLATMGSRFSLPSWRRSSA